MTNLCSNKNSMKTFNSFSTLIYSTRFHHLDEINLNYSSNLFESYEIINRKIKILENDLFLIRIRSKFHQMKIIEYRQWIQIFYSKFNSMNILF